MNPVKLKIVAWLVAAVVTALLVALAGQTYRLTAEQRDHAKTRQDYAEKIATLERQGREAVEAARAEEKRRQADLEAIVNETEQKLDAALADRDTARDVGQRLRDQIAVVASRCGGGPVHTGPAKTGQTATAPGDMLSDVLGIPIKELAENRLCCGFGGSFGFDYPEVSERLMNAKLDNAAATGAHTVVTDNQGCIMHLRGGCDAARRPMTVSHIAELISRRMRQRQPTPNG